MWIYLNFGVFCSALDAESEYLVQDALHKLMVGRTTIIIAHRLSTIKAADQVAVVDGGQIAECGKYEDLIKKENGIFRQLVDKQSNMNDRWNLFFISSHILFRFLSQ